jgi:organic radical activating enzyme
MPTTLIKQNPTFSKKVEKQNKLAIAEMFCDTLQGEGVNTGVTATFVRLQGCTLQCTWCDTLSVWPHGNEYSFDEIFALFESVGLISRLKSGQHLILTGGSPLKQQEQLINFINAFVYKYDFKPYIEVENECILPIDPQFARAVDCWNNSPKLANSGMKLKARYKADVIEQVAAKPNSWFKFVVSGQEDWNEIEELFLKPDLIRLSQVILMPCGENREQLNLTREIAANLAIENGVRYSDRQHVVIWDKKTGV